MLESLVDLTYRGIALGRAVKLTQIRPGSGYLELATPMPVGSELSITADGITFGARVTWIHEQVAGSDRAPGMTIAPKLLHDLASAWWQARIGSTDDDPPKPTLPRNRPVTVRPRSHTRPSPPPEGALTGNTPAIMADLAARIAGASATAAAAAVEAKAEHRAGATGAAAPAPVELQARSAADLAFPEAGEHVVVDDGAATMIMAAVDPASLDLEPGSSAAMVAAAESAPGQPVASGSGTPDEPPPAADGPAKRKKRRTR